MPLWMKFTSFVGVPGAGLLLLLYFLTQSLTGDIQAHAEQSAGALDELIRISRQICVNAGDTAEERAGCFRSTR